MRVQVATKFACDFCGKTQDEVASLIRGPKDVCICSECVALCVEVVADQGREEASTIEDGK